ncbi:G1 family endopeptidase [Amycolatopsis sp. NBC_00345]|uniref:G1 family glutamic endopeptidase n=1 Tax=Amycolatopsis sp. NBC_00345 TaxID=2975955 RepID=UPI002E254A9F
MRISSTRRRGTITLAAAFAVVFLAAPTTASAGGFGPYSPQDNVWGGYVATGSNFTTISGSWVEPEVTCNSQNDVFAPWVGVDGYGSQTVEQTGVETNCENGSPQYRAWYEMYPAAPVYWDDAVSAGDHFTGKVEDTGGGNYDITLTDDTAGWTEHTTQNLGASDVSAEAVIESPSQSYPSFSSLDFSGITVNGQVFDTYSPQGLDSGGYQPSQLSNGAFSMTGGFAQAHTRHSQAKPQAPIRY